MCFSCKEKIVAILLKLKIVFKTNKPGAHQHRPVRTWFLKMDPVLIVGMRVCVCVFAPEVINNQWHDVA